MNRLLPSARSLAFGAVLAVISAAEAQTWEVFDTTSAGFPSNSVVDIAIDRQNIVWVATDWGLCRYDGTNWQIFQTDNSGLPENTIQCIAVDTLDRLWVGTLFHGVVVYDGMTWTAFDQTNSGLPDDQIRSITIDHRNWAWVGTYLGAACYTGSEWRLYNDQPTSYNGLVMNGSVINDVAVREDGLVAIATLNGGFHYLTDTCIHYHSTFTDFFPDNTQTAVAFDPNLDQRWIATPSHGLIRHFDDWYSGLYFVYSTQSSTIPSNGLTSLAMDALGRPWMGSNYAGVFYRSEDGSFTTYNSANSGLPDNTISSVIFAPDGTLWVGTFYGGAARLTFPMGILEPSRKVALDVYPNPTSERAWVNWPHGSFGATWRLMDVTGKVEKEGTIGADGWSELDLIGLSPGIHLLQVPSNGLYSQARLVVY
ncbi:MAG: hypothetical protein IT226_17305 [Flavobacteriales bacterium]|nr:hypothetical protein [Flavobacteriales bacterium]